MIASLHGKLIASDVNSCIVECGGIGFHCFVSGKTLGTLPGRGNEVFLHTYMVVKEDAVDLYGFSEQSEMQCFKLIISVSGVGPKIGLALLSAFSGEQIAMFVAGSDAKSLTAATGVGLKLAQRIVLELKDKVSSIPGGNSAAVSAVSIAADDSNYRKAAAALVSLGYAQSDALRAVSTLDASISVENMIREGLKLLARQV